jgi:hypothetical protein
MTTTDAVSRSTRPALATARMAVALLAAAAGCNGYDDAGPAHVDELPLLIAEPGLRIGNLDDPEAGFSRVSMVDVDLDGNLFVVEQSVPEIRVYSAAGVLLRRFGRRGGGPGEFESLVRFGVRGDTVWTVDTRLRRITLFDRDGNVLSTGRFADATAALPNGSGMQFPWVLRPDGRFTSLLAGVMYSASEAPVVAASDSIPIPLIAYDASGAVTDTLGWAHRPPPGVWRPAAEGGGTMNSIEIDGRRVFVPDPPGSSPEWLPLADGYALAENPLARSPEATTLSVIRFGFSGDTVYHRELRFTPERYGAAELDSIAAEAAGGGGPIVSEGGSAGPPPGDVEVIARRLRAEMTFPDFKPPLASAWVAQDESIWLRREGGDATVARWIILAPDGAPRGRLELPADLRVLWSRGDSFLAVDPDEYDVPWVVRFTLSPPDPILAWGSAGRADLPHSQGMRYGRATPPGRLLRATASVSPRARREHL